MTKLSALTTFLLNLNLFAAEQLDAFVDDLNVIPSGRSTATAGQIVACEMDYTAVIYIERYPHAANPAQHLMAQISAWLLDNDGERTTGYQYPINVDILDAATADLEIRIPFHEVVTAHTDIAGAMTLNGTRYTVNA